MITRLRPGYTPAELAHLYPTPHDHTRWSDHRLRVDVTTAVARAFTPVASVADLSCGDGTIARALAAPTTILGDLAARWPIRGPIEQTILDLQPVDLFICTETLEHLDDPASVLREIRARTGALVASTPIGETDPAVNPEHIWGWDTDGFAELLTEAGFTPETYTSVAVPGLNVAYQIWGCR